MYKSLSRQIYLKSLSRQIYLKQTHISIKLVKKNIVFILPSLTSGGAERVVTTLANELISDFHIKIIQLYKSQPFYKLHKDIKLEHCKEVFNPSLTVFKSITNNSI